MRILVILICALSLMSCDVILDEAFDCIDNDRPYFTQNAIPDAILNQEYSASIKGAIKREPNDDRYNYAFRLEGQLPAGIATDHQLGSRTINITGTPTELGSYPFVLKVIVTEPESYYDFDQSEESYDDGDDLCRNTHEQRYVLEVVEE